MLRAAQEWWSGRGDLFCAYAATCDSRRIRYRVCDGCADLMLRDLRAQGCDVAETIDAVESSEELARIAVRIRKAREVSAS